jgi:hypothetical protein
MSRQYFCWKVTLTYRCGCTENTPVAHTCGPKRDGCSSWQTNRRSNKDCDAHRVLGLHSSDADFGGDGNKSFTEGEGGSVDGSVRQVIGEGQDEGQGQGREMGGVEGTLEGYFLRRRV